MLGPSPAPPERHRGRGPPREKWKGRPRPVIADKNLNSKNQTHEVYVTCGGCETVARVDGRRRTSCDMHVESHQRKHHHHYRHIFCHINITYGPPQVFPGCLHLRETIPYNVSRGNRMDPEEMGKTNGTMIPSVPSSTLGHEGGGGEIKNAQSQPSGAPVFSPRRRARVTTFGSSA